MIKFLLFILWVIGLTILIFTLGKVCFANEDITKYLTSSGILISAFIASTTVLLSIQNTKNLEEEKEKKEEQKNLAYLSQLCNTIYREVDKLTDLRQQDIKEDTTFYERNEEFFTLQLIYSKNTFELVIQKLNDKDLYKYMPIVTSLEKISTLMYNFIHVISRLSSEQCKQKDDKQQASFFNKIQIIKMILEGIDKTLIELNTELIKKIPDIQSQSILNESLLKSNT